MKSIRLEFEDREYRQLKKIKKNLNMNWKQLMLSTLDK